MDFSQFHFAQPLWLWLGLAIPLLLIVYYYFYSTRHLRHQLEKFIDPHLIPYLLIGQEGQTDSKWKTPLWWSIVWVFLILALAGPRWSFRETEAFSKDQTLVILLDLSESMNAKDVKPSRLIRAKQKIEDLINASKGVKLGLIAFAADPHMIAPVTDDKETIRHLLPSLNTDLVYMQGSRLSSAMEMASVMLSAEPGQNKSLLILSDGGFEDASAITTAKNLANKGIVIHAMGIGTIEGAPLQDHEGNSVRKNGNLLFSKLEKEKLTEISRVGQGYYLDAGHANGQESLILQDLENRSNAQLMGKKNQMWEERFYVFLLPILPIFLWWFRRGHLFALILMILFYPCFGVQAGLDTYFKNSEQLGKEALDKEDYDTASHLFQDPYRKGIAYYKGGNYAEAERMFQENSRDDLSINATYNLGNARVKQQKFKEAIEAYEDVLKKQPDHVKAKDNLELTKKMLEQQQEQQQQQSSSNKDQQDQQNQENQKEKESNDSENKENQNSSSKDKNEKGDSTPSQDNEQQKEEQDQPEQKERDSAQEQKERDSAQEQKDPDSNQDQNNQQGHSAKLEEEQNADLWLNQIKNDPQKFLKNKFYIESKKNGTKEGIDPW